MKKQTTITKWILTPLAMIMLNLGLNAQNAGYTVAGVYGRTQQDLTKLPKMERDIVILQNVLNDLFSGDRGSFYSSRGAKGIYVPGKGVIFNVGSNNSAYNIVLADQLYNSRNSKADAEAEEEKSATEKNKEIEDRLESLSKEFLVNYGSILSDLKSGEQVMLNVNYSAYNEESKKSGNGVTVQGGSNLIYRGSGRMSQKRMVSSIDYSTIDSYLNGNSSLNAATNKIKHSIVDKSDQSAQDAKIMAGILDDLFQSNFEGAFRRSGKTSWTYFDGFGLMYDLSLTGNHRGGLITYTAPVASGSNARVARADEKEEDKAEIEKKAEENYDGLIDMIKESLVTYGRTLRSVKSDEVVILNLNFGSSFRNTKLPKAIRLQVSKKQIESFSKGNKSLDQLKKEIDITKLSASASHSHYSAPHYELPGAVIPENVIEVAPEDAPEPIIVRGTRSKAKGN